MVQKWPAHWLNIPVTMDLNYQDLRHGTVRYTLIGIKLNPHVKVSYVDEMLIFIFKVCYVVYFLAPGPYPDKSYTRSGTTIIVYE